MCKLIVIEGSDGSGKETQTKLLFQKLKEANKPVRLVSFPNYPSPSSSLVKMYLNKELGEDAMNINPYVASSFYAVDRFATFQKEWKAFYEQCEDGIIICDRYVCSNMIHQAAKIKDTKKKDAFLDWEYDFEYEKGGLPKPDFVFFLDVPPAVTFENMRNRANKITDKTEKDIHESNAQFLIDSYENSQYLIQKYGWTTISCCIGNQMRSIEDINKQILSYIQ